MMKRMLSATLALVCVLGLTACGSKGEEVQPYDTALVSDLAEAGAFSEELEELDADTAFALYRLGDYDLTREDLTDAAVLRSTGATCEEAAVLVFADADKAATAHEAMEAYVEGQIKSNTDYRPNDIPKLEHAINSQAGNTLLLVVANDNSAVEKVQKG